ncbi:MAG: amidohydrolase [Bacteroidia bacterium]|nr:amidohydrolase [Bacteroidia bacterium]
MDTLRIGWVQMDIAWEAPLSNITRVERLIQGKQADLWVLPEMWSTGFSMETDKAEPEGGVAYQAMREWAEKYQALLLGSLQVRIENRARNRAYAILPDGRTYFYDKRHLFRIAGESLHYEAGDRHLVVEWKGWHIAPLICYDLRFPVWSRRRPDYDYDLLVYIANWPESRHAHWSALLPARAIENQAYVLGVNRIGVDGNQHHYLGGSMLLDYKGEMLLHAGNTEGAFVAEIRKSPLVAYRERFPVWRDSDSFQFSPEPFWG